MPFLKKLATALTKKTKKVGSDPDYISSGGVSSPDFDILEEESKKEKLRQLRRNAGYSN
jgi:hypothetical protein